MGILKSLSHHIVLNIVVTVIVMATGHIVFYLIGQAG